MDLPGLLQAAAAREEEAWSIFVDRYGGLVWRLLGRFIDLTVEERRDLSQDVFVILMNRALQEFRGSTENEFRSYLKIITENRAKRHLRRHCRRLEVLDGRLSLDDEDDPEWASSVSGPLAIEPSPGPEQLVAEQEIRQRFRCCLREIPLPDQQIFWLRERGVPYKEISETLGIPQGTVASRYFRAKEKIQDFLRKSDVL
jgi:RNA polymerase sigma-70 factor (ECF subfamily)